MRRIISAHFNMRATVLSQGGFDTTPGSTTQDPDTGEIKRVWASDSDLVLAGTQLKIIKCVVRGIISKTTRGEGTSMKIDTAGIILDTDYVMMNFLPTELLSKRDRITNITNRYGITLWKEEEISGAPTIFQVMGVTPMFDPFGTHIANHALLMRAEVQT